MFKIRIVQLLMFIIVINLLTISSSTSQQPYIEVSRSGYLGSTYMIIKDTVRANIELPSFSITFPMEFYNALLLSKASMDNSILPLSWEIVNNSAVLKISESIPPNKDLEILYVLKSSAKVYELIDENTANVTIPLYLNTKYWIAKFNATIYGATWFSHIISSEPSGIVAFTKFGNGSTRLKYSGENIAPNNNTLLKLSLGVSEVQWISIEKLEREIVISESGSITIKDRYFMRNLGPNRLEVWRPLVLDKSLIKEVRGIFKPLEYDQLKNGWDLIYNVNNNESFQITVIWKPKNIAHISGDQLSIEFDLTYGIEGFVKELITEISLPSGSNIDTIIPEPDESFHGNPLIARYYAFNVIPNSNKIVKLEAKIPTYVPILATVSDILLILIALSGIAFIYFKVVTQRPPRVEIKVPKGLKELSDLYFEKYKLEIELEDLEKTYRQGKVRRPVYIKRRRAILNEIKKVEFNIKNLVKHVRRDPKISKIIDEIEESDALLRSFRVAISQLDSEYKSGRIEKRTYTRLYAQHLTNIEKTLSRIESLIYQLRELSS